VSELKQVVLINLPSPFLIDDQVMPPLGLLYISSYLKKHKVSVEVIDLSGGEKFPSINADWIGISATTPQYEEALRILTKIKARNRYQRVIIGGPHATCMGEKLLFDGFDGVVIGEGERAMYKIVCFGNDVLPVVQEPEIEDLDILPFPDREAINLEKYKYFIDDERATTMITSRGCPFHCAFCSHTWESVRFRSAGNVLAEVDEIQKKFGYNAIMFYDDNFTLNISRLKKICKGLKKRGVKWRCLVRANLVNEELLKRMRKSGCVEILAGLESMDQDILNGINKGTTVEQNYEVTRLARKAGLRFKALLMIGLPGESHESVEKIREYLEKMQPDDFDLTIYTPYPKSLIWEFPEMFDIKIDYEKLGWYKGRIGEYRCAVSTSKLRSDEIVRLRDEIEKEFSYLKKSNKTFY